MTEQAKPEARGLMTEKNDLAAGVDALDSVQGAFRNAPEPRDDGDTSTAMLLHTARRAVKAFGALVDNADGYDKSNFGGLLLEADRAGLCTGAWSVAQLHEAELRARHAWKALRTAVALAESSAEDNTKRTGNESSAVQPKPNHPPADPVQLVGQEQQTSEPVTCICGGVMSPAWLCAKCLDVTFMPGQLDAAIAATRASRGESQPQQHPEPDEVSG